MILSFADSHVRGLALTAAGALLWSPDGLMVRLMDAGDGRNGRQRPTLWTARRLFRKIELGN